MVVLLYSIGSIEEGHGPALSKQNDDLFAIETCKRISKATGFRYEKHLPYSSDRVGEIARDWCPVWIAPSELMRFIIRDMKSDIARMGEISHVIIFSGHGGNNFLKDAENEISGEIGVPFLYLIPYDGVMVDTKHGKMGVGHADNGEHSVAAYMGLLDKEKLDMINLLAAKDPREAMRKWKPLSGLGGYVLFGGERYDALRNPAYGLRSEAERFIEEKRILADPEIGKELFEKNLEVAIQKATDFVGKD